MGWYPGIIGNNGGGGGGGDLLEILGRNINNSFEGRSGFKLTDEVFQTSATQIRRDLFMKNIDIEEVNLSSVLDVGAQAFYNCYFMSKISLPNCTHLSNAAFHGSGSTYVSPSQVYEIYLPKLKLIEDSALREIAPVTDNTDPSRILPVCDINLDSCETIRANAFAGIDGKKFMFPTLNLPAIQWIGEQAFRVNDFGDIVLGSNCSYIFNSFKKTNIETLTVLNTTPPVLQQGKLGESSNIGHIYVPSGAVSAYQAATGWSNYTIEAISE